MQFEWKYLQRTVPRVGILMVPIEEALREKFSHTVFGWEEIDANFWKIIGHSVKHGSLGIPDPRLSAEISYNTSNVASGELVDSLLGGTVLNYVGHRACICRASAGAQKEQKHVEMADLDIQKELTGRQERKLFHRSARNGAWLSAVPNRLNGT